MNSSKAIHELTVPEMTKAFQQAVPEPLSKEELLEMIVDRLTGDTSNIMESRYAVEIVRTIFDQVDFDTIALKAFTEFPGQFVKELS